jgi:AcrR family transcriptional regulator
MPIGMSDVKPESRRDKARATRARILAAAEVEFLDRGFHGATIANIARRAGVAAQTVYFVFNTKAALISAVIDNAVMGEGEPTIPQASEWWAAMMADPSADAALRHFIDGAGPMFARASAISEILRAAALTDDEVRHTHEFHEGMRRDGFGQVITLLAEKASLKPELTVQTATDILMVIFGDTLYYLMTAEYSWTHDQLMDWLRRTLPVLLLA